MNLFKPAFVWIALSIIAFCQGNIAYSQSTSELLSGVAQDNDLVIYLDSAPLKANALKAQQYAQSQKTIKGLDSVKKLLGQMDYDCQFSGRSLFCTKKYSRAADFIDMDFEELVLSIDRFYKTLTEFRRVQESRQSYEKACKLFLESFPAVQQANFESPDYSGMKYSELSPYQQGILQNLYWMQGIHWPLRKLTPQYILKEVMEKKRLKFGWKKVEPFPCFMAEAEYNGNLMPIFLAPVGSGGSVFSQSVRLQKQRGEDPSEPKPADYQDDKPLLYPWEPLQGETIEAFLKRESPERVPAQPFVARRSFYVFGLNASADTTRKFLEVAYRYVDYSEDEVKKFGYVPGRIKLQPDFRDSVDYAISPIIYRYVKGGTERVVDDFWEKSKKRHGPNIKEVVERRKNDKDFYFGVRKTSDRDVIQFAGFDSKPGMIRRLRVLLERPGGDKFKLIPYTELSLEAKNLADMILYDSALNLLGAMSSLVEYRTRPEEKERIYVFRDSLSSGKITVETREYNEALKKDIVMARFTSDGR